MLDGLPYFYDSPGFVRCPPIPSKLVKPDFLGELKDAVTPRAAGLMLAVLVVQLAFIGSYIGAFHAPKPQRIPIAVVYPGPADNVLAGLNWLEGKPLRAHQVPDEATARR